MTTFFFSRGGGQDAPLLLSTGHGVVDAADAQADEDVSGAALVGAYAVANLLGAALSGLVGEVGVGDEGSDHADQVDDTVGQELLGEGWGVDAACAQDGKADQLLDLVGFVDELAGLPVVAWPVVGEGLGVGDRALPDVQIVDSAGAFEEGSDSLELVHADTVVDHVVIQADAEGGGRGQGPCGSRR